mgnify:CR=1 FL=1
MAGRTENDVKNPVLQVQGVSKDYIDGERKLRVLTDLDLIVDRAEFVAIIGQSGSGKSTLMHLIGALDRPTSGKVLLDGQNYATLSDRELARLRSRSIGFVYQFHHLLPEFTALENVLLPAMIARVAQAEAVRMAEELLSRVGLAQRLDHRPTKLSGGEQQRVAVVRAVINNPSLILADEPTGNLDTGTAADVLQFLIDITKGSGRTLVMVTHDPGIAKRADRVFKLESGRLKTA